MLNARIKKLFKRSPKQQCPECGTDVEQSYCDTCGYDLIQKTRDNAFQRPTV